MNRKNTIVDGVHRIRILAQLRSKKKKKFDILRNEMHFWKVTRNRKTCPILLVIFHKTISNGMAAEVQQKKQGRTPNHEH